MILCTKIETSPENNHQHLFIKLTWKMRVFEEYLLFESNHCIDCNGGADRVGSYLLHGVLERERHPIRVPLLHFIVGEFSWRAPIFRNATKKIHVHDTLKPLSAYFVANTRPVATTQTRIKPFSWKEIKITLSLHNRTSGLMITCETLIRCPLFKVAQLLI